MTDRSLAPREWATAASPLGWLHLLATPGGVVSLAFADAPTEPHGEGPLRAPTLTTRRWLDATMRALEQPGRGEAPRLVLEGTPFQRSVWSALTLIAPGETLTYGALAHRIGRPTAARAVAAACAANRVALWIPCHRIVAADGSTGGYRWGSWRKRWLLQREARLTPDEAARRG